MQITQAVVILDCTSHLTELINPRLRAITGATPGGVHRLSPVGVFYRIDDLKAVFRERVELGVQDRLPESHGQSALAPKPSERPRVLGSRASIRVVAPFAEGHCHCGPCSTICSAAQTAPPAPATRVNVYPKRLLRLRVPFWFDDPGQRSSRFFAYFMRERSDVVADAIVCRKV